MIFNKPNQTPRRRTLRINSTEPEQLLWARIRDKQLGVKFRRQHGVGNYIADFYCAEKSLVVELDGDSHYTDAAQLYDEERNRFMSAQGLMVLRFTNREVVRNMEGVLERILEVLRGR